MRYSWILAVMIFLAACEKKYCWDCEINSTTIGISPAGDSVKILEGDWEQQFDKTEREIDELEKQKTGSTITVDNGYTTDKTINYHCEKAD